MSVFHAATPAPPSTRGTTMMGYLVPPLVIPMVIAIAVGLFVLIHGPVA